MRTGSLALIVAAAGLACGGGQRSRGAPTCADAARGAAHQLATARAEVAEAKVDAAPELEALCTIDAWTEPARGCFRDAATPDAARACARQLTEPQRAHARTVQAEIITRAEAALRVRGGPGAGSGIAECDRYLAAIDDFLACNAAPQAVRDAARQGRIAVQDSLAGLVNLDGPSQDSTREAFAMACRQLTDAILQSASAAGC